MTKFRIIAAALAIACTLPACSNKEQCAEPHSAKTTVKVSLNGFKICTDAGDLRSVQTKAQSAGEAGVEYISFAVIDSGGEIVHSVKQKSTDDDFGNLSFDLTEGEYTLVAEGNSGMDNATLSVSGGTAYATLGSSSLFNTFSAAQSLTVPNVAFMEVEMTLNRILASLELVTTADRPSKARTVEFTVGDPSKPEYSSFTVDVSTGYMSGFGTDGCLKVSRVVTGSGPTTSSLNLLLASKEQSLPVKIDVKTVSGDIICSHSIASVPFKQNRKTVITGPLYSIPGESSITFNTEWEDPADGGW